MASSIIGQLRIILGIDAADVGRGAADAERRMTLLTKRMEKMGKRISGIGLGLSAALSVPFAALVREAIPAAKESAQAIGQVEAALKSMGSAAGRNSEQLQEQAKGLMRLSTFDDDEILRKVTANLLTFGNVAKEQFDRAQLAAVDLSTRMGGDLQAATLLVGKSLNDPVKGMAALRRVGIQLTEQQKSQIEGFVKTNQLAKAQGIILTELERQFGGSAKAMRDATPGMDLKNAWDDFNETVGGIVLKVLPPLTAMLATVLDRFNELSPGAQQFAVAGAAIAAAIGPVVTVLGGLVSLAAGLVPVFAPLIALIGEAGLVAALGAAATAAAPFIAAGAAIAAVWLAFGDRIGPVLTEIGSKFQEVLGPKILSLIQTISGVLTELWNGPLGELARGVIATLGDLLAGLLKVFGEVALRAISGFVELLKASFDTIGNALKIVTSLLNGDFAGAWEATKKLVSDAAQGWLRIFEAILPGITGMVGRLYAAIKYWLLDKLGQVWDWVERKVRGVGEAFAWLYDVVVGHSYIPDMVDEIGQHMARLDKEMVEPTKKATTKAEQAFQSLRDKVRGLMGELYPELKLFNEFKADMADMPKVLAKDGFTEEQIADALRRRTRKYADERWGKDDLDFPDSDVLDRDPPPLLPKTIPDETAANLRQTFRDTFSDGLRAALNGDFKGFFKSWLTDTAARGLEAAMNKLADGLADLFSRIFGAAGQSGGSGGDIFSSIGKALGTVFGSGTFGGGPNPDGSTSLTSKSSANFPKFANGGSFEIGGRPGIDRNLVQFWGSKDEVVDIRKKGADRGPGGDVFRFDLRGAVMTQDLLNQMNAIGAGSAQAGTVGGAGMVAYKRSRSLVR